VRWVGAVVWVRVCMTLCGPPALDGLMLGGRAADRLDNPYPVGHMGPCDLDGGGT
jgi:hypothetical protein